MDNRKTRSVYEAAGHKLGGTQNLITGETKGGSTRQEVAQEVVNRNTRASITAEDGESKSRVYKYSKERYNAYGWAVAENILEAGTIERLITKINELNNLNYKFNKARNNTEYIIPMSNVQLQYNYLIYTDNNAELPHISKVIILYETDERITQLWEELLNERKYSKGYIQSKINVVQDTFPDSFFEYALKDSPTYKEYLGEWQNDERKNNDGTIRRGSESFVGNEFDGERTDTESNGNSTENTQGRRYSVSISETDAEYMTAVKSGDMETAQRLVKKAAKEAGYTEDLFHGTGRFGFTKPNVKKSDDGISFFATDDFLVAQSYTSGLSTEVRRINEKNKKLSRRDVPEIKKQTTNISREFIKKYSDILGYYDEFSMRKLDFVTDESAFFAERKDKLNILKKRLQSLKVFCHCFRNYSVLRWENTSKIYLF